jgi:hypothetical protein
MKKTLLIVFVLILVLALATGCGGQSAAKDDPDDKEMAIDAGGGSGPESAKTMEWPASDLPLGLPAYPDGVIESIDMDEFGVIVNITETGETAYQAYLKTLEADGWKPVDWDDSGTEAVELMKGSYLLVIDYFEPGDVIIVASDFGEDMEGIDVSSGSTEWPTDLPYPLPKYTDGEVSRVNYYEDDGLSIYINSTSMAAYKKYVDEAAKAGWELYDTFGDDGDVIIAGSAFLYKDKSLTVYITKDDDVAIMVHTPEEQE